jgi:hypothetical protein
MKKWCPVTGVPICAGRVLVPDLHREKLTVFCIEKEKAIIPVIIA